MLNLHKYEIVPLKKSKRPHARKILAQSWINFIQWFLRYCHLRVYANFSNDPWRPSWIVNLHNYEMVLFRDNCDLTKIHLCFLEILAFERNWTCNH